MFPHVFVSLARAIFDQTKTLLFFSYFLFFLTFFLSPFTASLPSSFCLFACRFLIFSLSFFISFFFLKLVLEFPGKELRRRLRSLARFLVASLTTFASSHWGKGLFEPDAGLASCDKVLITASFITLAVNGL